MNGLDKRMNRLDRWVDSMKSKLAHLKSLVQLLIANQ
jgi:hypothetical protein